jgi:DNA-binding NtrC family response regulator
LEKDFNFMPLTRRAHSPVATIFVVDDEVALLELAKVVLGDMGYNVLIFTNPQVALAEFEKIRPELVLTDYWMPRMSGMDLIRECRRLNPQQKAVLISGTVDSSMFANAPVKPDQFVAKPYDVQKLRDLVAGLLAA